MVNLNSLKYSNAMNIQLENVQFLINNWINYSILNWNCKPYWQENKPSFKLKKNFPESLKIKMFQMSFSYTFAYLILSCLSWLKDAYPLIKQLCHPKLTWELHFTVVRLCISVPILIRFFVLDSIYICDNLK